MSAHFILAILSCVKLSKSTHLLFLTTTEIKLSATCAIALFASRARNCLGMEIDEMQL